MNRRFVVLVDGRPPSDVWLLTTAEAVRIAAHFRRTRPDSVVEVKRADEKD